MIFFSFRSSEVPPARFPAPGHFRAAGRKVGSRFPRRSREREGVALVLVLTILVLVAALTLGFITLVTTERQASASYVDDARTRLLADTAVNLVIGQIRQATDTLNDNPANPLTWASQPGMIRVYGADGGTGSGGTGRADLERAYKLYSSDAMTVTKFGAAEATAEVPPTDWKTQPARFADLNQPVKTADPANPALTKLRYPIFDPNAVGKVEGVELSGAPGADLTQPAPMPVKWLYVLKDGRYVAPADVPGQGRKLQIPGATETNPIIGRIAFWTDDECSKVNINTASEGVFWDTPKANTTAERKLASYLPARYEFQRYPGHPATVSLSAVLGGFLTNVKGATTAGSSAFGLYYDLAPRVQTGGSLDGTRTPTAALNVIKDNDRLYATVDEYFFKAASLTQGLRDSNSSELTAETLAETEFFLTAQSRAPEVTLMNTPRVCLWPLQVVQPSGTTTARNAYDKLIAFCSSLGEDKTLPSNYPADMARGYPYYYQRKQVQHLLNSNPASPSSANPTADYAQIPRNQAVYAYLQKLTERSIPGFGGSFRSKYPNDRDQILTECFDYTRSLVNAISTPRQNLTPHYSYGPYYYDFGIISPIKIGSTMGQGRFVTVSQAALLFYPTEIDATDSENLQTKKMRARLILQPYCISPGASAFNQKYQMRASGMSDFKADAETLKFPVVNGSTVNGIRKVDFNEGYYLTETHAPANKTAYPSPAGQMFYYKSGAGGYLYDAGQANYQFDIWASSGDIDVSGKQTFQFTGGTVTVDVYAPDGTAVQTLKIQFPDQTLQVPKRASPFNDAGRQAVSGKPTVFQLDYRNRFVASLPAAKQPSGGSYVNVSGMLMDNMIYPGDTVYSVGVHPTEKAQGDMRLIAYRPGVGTDSGDAARMNYFAPDGNFAGASWRVGYWTNAGQFRRSWSENFKNSVTGGKLVQGLAYPEDAVPMVPRGLNGARNQYNAPGDWDTGYDIQEDGPYVNKADEASVTLGYFNRGVSLGYVNALGTAGWESGATGSQGAEVDNITYSPNRQVASAVMYGSLPTGVYGKDSSKNKPEPWQTLLFTPHPAAGSDHYGLKFPQDHLWLDLFWMPIVEPYAISEPFSTAGKVNMNYEIMPFRCLKRRTAVEAVLKSTRLTAIPNSDVATYKRQPTSSATNASSSDYRLEINPDAESGTLRGFEERFEAGDIFRSATEICTVSLVPKASGANYSGMSTWWESRALTGDNLRESPYNQLYPRLTTKSNTYTVHMRVQSLKKNAAAGSADEWDEARDAITGEYRGSCLIERYIDPNETTLPDFASSADTNSNGTPDDQEALDKYYKFRVIQRRQFAP